MEKILVTTDLSANSKAGLRFAMQLASQRGSELVFYHAIEVMRPTSWNDKHYRSFADKKTSEFMDKLKKFVASVQETAPVPLLSYHYTVEIGTEVSKMAIRYAKKAKAKFICMSTHGAGKLEKLLGTHASALITSSPIPVVVVPKNYRAKPLTSVFYASDFAKLSTELTTVRQFADTLRASVDVFHYDYLMHVEENRKKLEKKAEKNAHTGVRFHFRRQEIDLSLSENIKADIQKIKPSIIVLFTKQNRNWFDRLFARSNSKNMVFHAGTPLLVMRKKQ